MEYKKNPASVAIVIILVLVVLGVLAYLFTRKPEGVATVTPPVNTVVDTTTQTAVPPAPTLAISGNTADLVKISVTPGERVYDQELVSGSIKGGYFFEANARGSLLDAQKKDVFDFPVQAASDWMTSDAVDFNIKLNLSKVPDGLFYLRIRNDNPSGDPSRDKYVLIPLTFN